MATLERSTGQPEAMASCFDHQRARLVRIAERILGDRHEAEDVVQDTALAVWQRLEAQPVRHVDRYVARAVRLNALMRRARRRGRRALVLDEGRDLPITPDESSADFDEIDPLELESAILDLPVPQQAVIRLRYYTGCRYALQRLRKMLHRSER